MTKQLKHYFLHRYVRCGEMPFFLIFCRDKRGMDSYCIMLSTLGKLRQMVRLRRGFPDPAKFGRILYDGKGSEPNEMIREMLKARYDFDFEKSHPNEVRFFSTS
jgi:hypothetical protein